jgi:4-amino-4-deoxy-L-arabinose transferase-like glycosyltransferase
MRKPPTVYYLFLSIIIAIVAINDVTKFRDLPPRWIGHGDQADVAVVARNIAEGKGAVTDAIWLLTNGGLEGGVPIPEPYWSIYVAVIISIFFGLFSDSLTALLIPAAIAKSAITALAALITYRISGSHISSIGVGVLLSCLGLMTKAVNGLSDIYLTLFILAGSLAVISAVHRQSLYLSGFSGLLTGISIGIKPSGLLLAGVFFLLLFYFRKGWISWRCVPPYIIGVLIGVWPLVSHNYDGFGSAISPALALTKEATDISFLTNHNNGFYNPEPHQYTDAELQQLSSGAKYTRNIQQFFQAVLTGEIFPALLLPIALFGIAANLRKLTPIKSKYPASFNTSFALASVLVLMAAVLQGIIIHMEERYWNFIVPFLAIWAVIIVENIYPKLIVIVSILVITSYANANIKYNPEPIPQAYSILQNILPANSIVMTADPWEFAFHTRRYAVMTPYTDKHEVITQVQKRYGAQYLTIIRKRVRHNIYNQFIDGIYPDYLEPIHSSNDLIVLKFK